MADTDRKIIIVNVLIHGFAIAHAWTAASLSQTMGGDDVALTALTVAMIVSISRVYNRPWGVGDGLAVIGCFAGFYVGTRGALFLVKWIPGVGNGVNAITTFMVTEILGWATYIIVKEGKNPHDMDKSDAKSVWQKAKTLREDMKEEQERIKQVLKSMSVADKARYDSFMEKLKDKNLPQNEFAQIEKELDALFKRYGY
jgi:uncharacterized protein (DUF697 family)